MLWEGLRIMEEWIKTLPYWITIPFQILIIWLAWKFVRRFWIDK